MSSVTICVGNLADLPDLGCREFSRGDAPVPHRGFLVRRGSDLVAYRNLCPHGGRPLNWQQDKFLDRGKRVILCTGHGAEFEIATGECLRGPCPGQSLAALPVRVVEGLIYVDVG